MARKALFATDDQPARRSEEEVGVDHQGDDSVAGGESSEASEEVKPSPKRKAPVVVTKTPEQIRAELGIEEELLNAIRNREDDETIFRWIKEQAQCCGELTLQRLTQAKAVTGGEAQSILESYGYYVDDVAADKNILDILAFHIWVKLDTKDVRAEREIRGLTSQLAPAVPSGVTHCVFPHTSDTPTELYEKFPLAEKICSTLMCPIVQANERDFVSVASINPITSATVGVLLEHIMEREGVRPFTFVLTMGSGAWAQLCEKQFGIEV